MGQNDQNGKLTGQNGRPDQRKLRIKAFLRPDDDGRRRRRHRSGKARASNETLYHWYGDKTGLFRELVKSNAQRVRQALEHHLSTQDDPIKTLRHIGPILLDLLLGARAVALNRAAAADPSGELGAVISQQGRETVGPLIGQVLLQARDRGQLHFDAVNDALDLYLGLLVGDLQIRRVIGRVPQPTQAEMAQRSAQAVAHLTTLLKD